MATLAHPASVASRIRQPALISLYQSAYRNTAPAALRARLFPTAMSAPCASVPAAAAPLLAARRRCARACAVAPAPCQRGASFSGRVAPLALATPRRADSHSKRTHRPAAAALPVSAAASTVRRPPRMLGDAAVPPVACTATARALLPRNLWRPPTRSASSPGRFRARPVRRRPAQRSVAADVSRRPAAQLPRSLPAALCPSFPGTGTRRTVAAGGKAALLFWYRDAVYAVEPRSPAEGAYSEGFAEARLTQVRQTLRLWGWSPAPGTPAVPLNPPHTRPLIPSPPPPGRVHRVPRHKVDV